MFNVHGFTQEIVGPFPHGIDDHLFIADTRDQDDRSISRRFIDLF